MRHTVLIHYHDLRLLLVVKIVDDLWITGIPSEVKKFLTDFNKEFSFGSVVSVPGILKFYGLSIGYLDDKSSSFHADGNLNVLEGFV